MPANPFDAEKQEAVKTILTGTLENFAKAYPKFYALALVNKIRAEKEEEAPARLLLSPSPPEVRKEGFLTKLGAIRKNWKKRWFVVTGDYRISYYKSQPKDRAKAKPQGSFSCFGYKVKAEADKSDSEKKENTVVLGPYWSDDLAKRVYQFTAANEEEFKEWTSMFTECCRNAGNPMHEQEERREAFGETYMHLEEEAGWHPYSFRATGTEADMLTYHINKRCDYEVMRDVYSAVPENPMRNTIINKIRGGVAKTIATGVDAAWKAATAAVDKIEEPTEKKIREVEGTLNKPQDTVMEKARGPINDKMAPALAEKTKPLGEKVMPKLAAPLAGYHKQLFTTFCDRTKDDKIGNARGFWWDLDSSVFDTVNEVVGAVVSELGIEVGDYSNLRWKAREECVELLEKALYTASVENRGSAAGKLFHDSLKVLEETMQWYIGELIKPSIMKVAGPLIEEVAGPLGELVPEPLQAFLDPVGCCETLVEEAIDAAIASVINFDSAEKPDQSAFKDGGVDVVQPDLEAAKKATEEEKAPDMVRQPSASEAQRPSVFYVPPEEAKDSDDEGNDEEKKEGEAVEEAEG